MVCQRDLPDVGDQRTAADHRGVRRGVVRGDERRRANQLPGPESAGDRVDGTHLERGIVADVALVHAHTADTDGNLVYRLTARNFNPLAAMAGRVCIAQVEKLVEPGEIDPDHVHLPGVYVHRIIEVGPDIEKRIERRTVRATEGA